MTQYDTVHLSPNLTAAAYIVHPPKMTSLHEVPESPPKELFLVEDIQNSIADHEDWNSSRLPVPDLFGGWNPSLEDIERITCNSLNQASLSYQMI